jgi:hypothetical protein
MRNGLRQALLVECNATRRRANASKLRVANSSGDADRRGISPSVLADRPQASCGSPPQQVHTDHPLSPTSRATPRGLFRPGTVNVYTACGALTGPARRAAKRPGGVYSRDARPAPGRHGATGSHGTDNPAGYCNILPLCALRASWRRDFQRLEPARCCTCDLRFSFPLSSQHLPFPSRNARVEVGRTVMEG